MSPNLESVGAEVQIHNQTLLDVLVPDPFGCKVKQRAFGHAQIERALAGHEVVQFGEELLWYDPFFHSGDGDDDGFLLLTEMDGTDLSRLPDDPDGVWIRAEKLTPVWNSFGKVSFP